MSEELYEGFGNADSSGFGPGSFSHQGLPGTPGVGRSSLTTAALMSSFNEKARPMTSNKAAGYTSKKMSATQQSMNDFISNTDLGPAPPLVENTEIGPEYRARELEKEINKLIEDSVRVSVQERQFALSLSHAKEAAKKERELTKFRERKNLQDSINFDLAFAVRFNLAEQFELNSMHQEALTTFSSLVRDKSFPQAMRLRINMGNIYYQQKKFPQANKMYRMALDQIGNANTNLRMKIMRNIGNTFVQLGQFADAVQSFERVMEAMPDLQTSFNLLVCYYALGDVEKMRKCFIQLVNVPMLHDTGETGGNKDSLSMYLQTQRFQLTRRIQMAAQLIAPEISSLEDSFDGYDWIVDHLKTVSQLQETGGATDTGDEKAVLQTIHRPQMLEKCALEISIAKGIAYIKHQKIEKAIEVFKQLEGESRGMLDRAATNLAFVYFLESDWKNANKYAEKAVSADRYNANALVNRANCLFVLGHVEQAKEMFLEAIGVEADCTEAIFNLGLVCKRLGHYNDALQAFRKLHRICPKDPQVTFHIAHLFELTADMKQSVEWYKVLQGAVPNDPDILSRLGSIYRKHRDETQAFHNYLDSYRAFPSDLEIISWLGVWYVNSELYENAITFFERAAQIEPKEVKWKLMVASCYRRMRNYQNAITIYKTIHESEPENVKCLEYLCVILKEINDPELTSFQGKLDELVGREFVQNEPVGDENMPRKENNSRIPVEAEDRQVVYDGKIGGDETAQAVSHKQPAEDDWGDGELGDDLLPS